MLKYTKILFIYRKTKVKSKIILFQEQIAKTLERNKNIDLTGSKTWILLDQKHGSDWIKNMDLTGSKTSNKHPFYSQDQMC